MTMNNKLRVTILAVVLSGLCAFTAQAQTRIGIVDYKKAISGYWRTKEATALLKESREEKLKELKGLGDQIKTGEDDYRRLSEEANDPLISAEERDKRKLAAEARLKAISEMKERARDFDQKASAYLNDQAQRMSERIDERIRAVVAAKAKTAGYTLVLDTAALSRENRPVVVYTSGENDITDSVLQQLNADAPPETAKPAEKK
jgi:Skp family chaperone for outer membrane proteins